MNSFNNSEDNMKNLAQNHQVTPPAMAWKNIEAALPTKRKRRFGFLFFYVIAALVLTGGLSFGISRMLGVNHATTVMDANAISNTTNSTVASIQSPANVAEPITATAIANENVQSELITQKNSNRIATSNATSNTASNKNTSLAAIRTETTENPIASTPEVDPKTTQVEDQKTIEQVTVLQERSIATKPVLSTLQMAQKPLTLLAWHNKLLSIHPLKIKIEDCPSFGQSGSRSKFFVDLEAGMGMPLKQMSARDGDITKSYAKRKESETPWYAWSAGVHAGTFVSRNFYLKTGVDYTQIKEKFDFSINGLSKIIISYNAAGVPIDTVIQFGSYVNSGEIRLSTIDVPLLVGYESKPNNWTWGVEGGPFVNASLRTSGKMLLPDNSVSTTVRQNDIYRSSLGFGLQGGLFVGKYIGSSTYLYLKPQMRYYFQEWSTDRSPVISKYSTMQLSLGVRKMF